MTQSRNRSMARFFSRLPTPYSLLPLFLLASALLLWAASIGPNSPDTGANVAGAGTDWASTGNIVASDDSRAYAAAVPAAGSTDLLRATDFDFTIPVGATIDGVVVEIERCCTSADHLKDLTVKLVKGGAETGDNKANAVTFWPSAAAEAYASYGSSVDMWGVALTPADVNANTFGASIAGQNAGAAAKHAYVDHMRITVHYTPAASTGRKAQIINISSLVPGWAPEAFPILPGQMSQMREVMTQ